QRRTAALRPHPDRARSRCPRLARHGRPACVLLPVPAPCQTVIDLQRSTLADPLFTRDPEHTMKLIIGNKNYSSWSLRAWLAAREGGFTFEEIRIPLFIPGSRERILSHSPSGKVPCLIDHGFTVWDSLAIGEYLAEKQPALLPPDPGARAIARAVTAEMHSGFQNLRSRMPMNIRKDYTGFGHSAEVDADITR